VQSGRAARIRDRARPIDADLADWREWSRQHPVENLIASRRDNTAEIVAFLLELRELWTDTGSAPTRARQTVAWKTGYRLLVMRS
jgi:hypothetical protein